jgi:2-succinyl-5-enolpyruvyl-6-hydroxy-3-cyclohexene-1-carboxylate synthase
MNMELAHFTLQQLLSLGVQEFCVCPGARNAPWIALFSSSSRVLKTYYFYEERSAAFFALGRIRQTQRPVAVVTTSGTAAGELLPATMEAHYSGLPLVLLTADRPRRFRNSGAPQTAEQMGLFGVYVSQSWDIAEDERPVFSGWSKQNPIHVNVCFSEPLLDSRSESWAPLRSMQQGIQFNSGYEVSAEGSDLLKIRSFFRQVKNPLVIVSMLQSSDREAVVQLLLSLNCPTYLEGVSGLREDERLQTFQIRLGDQILKRAMRDGYPIDGIIRIGGVPTLRMWRDLDLEFAHLPVLSLSRVPFGGLGRQNDLIQGLISQSCEKILSELSLNRYEVQADFVRFLEGDQKSYGGLLDLLRSESQSEPGMVARFSQSLSEKSRVYLGNSMPIREWDLAAHPNVRINDIWASRGLNGIDGQVSSFLGFSSPLHDNWALIGDLTALYDLAGPWVLSQLGETQVNLLVINNGGGKIFSRMFTQPEFLNRHQLRFQAWADLWQVHYEKWESVPDQTLSASRHRIIEMIPQEESTARFWKSFETLLK